MTTSSPVGHDLPPPSARGMLTSGARPTLARFTETANSRRSSRKRLICKLTAVGCRGQTPWPPTARNAAPHLETRAIFTLHLLACLALLLAGSLRAAEPPIWADRTLPVREGVELWLDAARENEAREAHYMNRLKDGDALDLWHDSSGHARHLAQWAGAMRPHWHAGAAGNSIWFGGNDFLAALLTSGTAWKEATVFIVAAPTEARGHYDGLFSSGRRGENDYTSGLNLDLGSKKSADWLAVNVEGAGQSGERNLLSKPVPLGEWRVLALRTGPGHDGTELRLDGTPQRTRDRGDVAAAADVIGVGARFTGAPSPEMKDFFTGGLTEVLVYGRRLSDSETAQIEAWLRAKHAELFHSTDPSAPHETKLTAAPTPPVVQVLAPGFTVRELPVKLTNLVNIEYAPDGRLFAAGYDGRFHLLRDTDGDGLEDKVDTFSPQTTDNYPLGVAVKDGDFYALLRDEIVRFRDTDGDGVPDLRETVRHGWDDPALAADPMLHHRRVDSALGFAIGPDGSYYVTMGSAAYDNGYWRDKEGVAHYSPDKRRGCLLRLRPDGGMDQLCSGVRYVISMQFNERGDLFGTDQEGATWLPNGNPFDELLHLEAGRHYGFPPRHPQWLLNVVDEPSVWDYSPQHQSTCGFRFNGPAAGRGRLGPEWWAHDAFVTGESRGKLWRTTLAKTAAGYVAQTQLIACLGMLAIDCAISPKGDLVVCCHSGPPDWGTGPSGAGRLFKISYVEPQAPQPIGGWPASPTETVVAFDRKLDPAQWADAAARTRIEYGRYVQAAERFESIRPGYAVVAMQQATPRYRLPVKSARLGEDGRSLILETAPRTLAANYAITIEGMGATAPAGPNVIPQLPALDLAHDLGGLAAEWRGADGAKWSGWLPHADFIAAREFTKASAAHQALWASLAQPGSLTLRTQLDLSHMLRPRVQPLSKLDYEPTPEVVTLSFRSDALLSLDAPGASVARVNDHEARLTVHDPHDGAFQPLTITLSGAASTLDVSYSTAEAPRPRALGIRRFLMPFAKPESVIEQPRVIPEIAGGHWENGHTLFKTKAACISCHAIRGEGVGVGPDLSNLIHRDYAGVMKDILDPSATINPDAVGYIVTLKSGAQSIGTRAGETADEIDLAQPGGAIARLRRSEIATTEPMTVSIMPPGLLQSLTPQEIKDLMTFLLTEAPGKEK